MDRVTQGLWRGVEGPRRCSSGRRCSELFNHRGRQCLSLESKRKEVPLTIQVRIAAESCCRVSVVEKLPAAWVN
jgi:hypothetical protein